ncbi:4Fe-4S dicluster domain-containing protein [Patescibacteria group bacterium]|nr:4Fe-4S dicluster domain-containing protein [Patescibacteria group bacterium]
MTSDMIIKFFNCLKAEKYNIYGPEIQDDESDILELQEVPDLKLLEKVSARPYKYHLMPIREVLYKYKDNKLKEEFLKTKKQAFFGMSVFDLKALELYDRVFQNDVYYQNNRKNLLAVGYSSIPAKNYKTIFFTIDEKILENIVFDVFIEGTKFYAQSYKGEKILKKCGLKYKKIDYNPRKEDKKVLAIKKVVETSKDSKLWEELGKICLACGKCTIACPTCFCFDIESVLGPEKKAERCSGNCFYDDFTRIAGGHKFLNNPKDKIFFWYYHKFVRIPHEYGLPGCTDCGRCTAVCPVGIDIEKNIVKLLKEVKNKKR